MELEAEVRQPARVVQIAMRLRAKPLIATLLFIGLFAGPLFAATVFPEVSLARQILGGWVFGLYFAMCAVPEQFLEL